MIIQFLKNFKILSLSKATQESFERNSAAAGYSLESLCVKSGPGRFWNTWRTLSSLPLRYRMKNVGSHRCAAVSRISGAVLGPQVEIQCDEGRFDWMLKIKPHRSVFCKYMIQFASLVTDLSLPLSSRSLSPQRRLWMTSSAGRRWAKSLWLTGTTRW